MRRRLRWHEGEIVLAGMLLVAALTWALVALAREAREAQPMQAQIDSCKDDALRLCPAEAAAAFFTHNLDSIRACMIAHKAEISRECRSTFR